MNKQPKFKVGDCVNVKGGVKYEEFVKHFSRANCKVTLTRDVAEEEVLTIKEVVKFPFLNFFGYTFEEITFGYVILQLGVDITRELSIDESYLYINEVPSSSKDSDVSPLRATSC